MAYIGRPSIVGNFVKLDAITAVNGQAAYTMQNNSANFSDYSTVNQFLVSLNGTIQSPGSSFTVSGSTITFSSNLVTNDVIDFIIVFGNSLSAGTPTDATVSTAKIVDDAVTAAKINNDIISGSTELASEPSDTDEFLVSDSGVIKRIDYSLIKASSPGLVKISTVTASDSANVDFDDLASTYSMYIIIGSQIRLATAGANFEINFGTDGSTYSANKTSAYFHQYNNEGDSDLGSGTQGSASHGNSGGNQEIMRGLNNNGTYGKAGQFRGYISGLGQGGNYASFDFFSSYFMNTNHAYGVRVNGQVQAAADCIRFIPSAGNIATGEFTLYGVNQ
ncbi:hypothetical protein [uncultured Mediterranean phage uvMED]|nr:hypothetical protein [uncultured Mediterranean phage uvMED]